MVFPKIIPPSKPAAQPPRMANTRARTTFSGSLKAKGASRPGMGDAVPGALFTTQGIWVKKDVFDAMGGFPNLPIMEDYEFSLRMQKAQLPICQLPGTIITSGRRYETRFPPLTMWQMFRLRCLYRKGMDIEEIARRYKDIR